MIRTDILDKIKKEKQRGEFIYPYYGKYSIAEIPQTVLSLFNYPKVSNILPIKYKAGDFEKVVFIFADAFGFDLFLKEHENYQLLKDLSGKGEVMPLTSIFPSTTSAATTLFHSGLTPQEHGLPEWFLYFKELGQIVESLPFRSIGSEETDEMLKKGGKLEMLFNGKTIYEKLNSIGVKSFVFLSQNYSTSAYSTVTQKGAEVIGFSNGIDLARKLKNQLENYNGKAYFMVYWDEIDTTGHHSGLGTDEHRRAMANLFNPLAKECIKKINHDRTQKNLFLLSADHGQIAIDPKKTIYLNDYPELVKNFTVAPTGNSRDVFLNIKENKIDETINLLKNILGDKAEIIRTSEAIKLGLFGVGTPTQRFLDRTGNILILPFKNKIWYRHASPKKTQSMAMHGGLSEQEMVVPFAYAKFADLL
ncbi:MAG: alkaline phosphatase family protein [Patescibacteria group bacterium]|nr:alkaline phosphatase family protein [Patescibacteria group bacterium]